MANLVEQWVEASGKHEAEQLKLKAPLRLVPGGEEKIRKLFLLARLQERCRRVSDDGEGRFALRPWK
jgi:hypothetical protein